MGGFGGFGGMGGFGGSNQQQQQDSNTNWEEKYASQLNSLEMMGFTNKQTNLDALKATGGNVEAAIERILNMIGK
jgi:ubiquilin